MSDGGVPHVSVVLPTRDRATSLGAAVDSVLTQESVDLELIVVDDGSRDGTPDLLASYEDPRVTVVRNERSLGPAGARNRALDIARGEVIAFQDSDDVWRPGALRTQLAELEGHGPRCVVAYSAVVMPGAGRIPGPCDLVRSGDLAPALARYNIVGLPAAVVRAESLRAVGGFDENLHRLEDWDLFLSLSGLGEFAYTDEVLVDVGRGEDRVTDRDAAGREALARILQKHRELFARHPVLVAAHRAQLAKQLAKSGHVWDSIRHAAGLLSSPLATGRMLAAHASRTAPLDRRRCTKPAS